MTKIILWPYASLELENGVHLPSVLIHSLSESGRSILTLAVKGGRKWWLMTDVCSGHKAKEKGPMLYISQPLASQINLCGFWVPLRAGKSLDWMLCSGPALPFPFCDMGPLMEGSTLHTVRVTAVSQISLHLWLGPVCRRALLRLARQATKSHSSWCQKRAFF